ncbi:MAG: exosome complex protein Rrp42 [Thermofilaceae archaeon]|nr:exosome complex protein Rrp42 [Thermofilaceae archaeon]MDW8004515.1 exosome complex protein Rrp42 [Thermofilaceae archaeon]
MSEKVYTIIPAPRRETIRSMIKRGERVDGRGPDQYRELKVDTGIAGNADGSAKVSLGHTKVVAGVKVSLGQPYPDAPAAGVLIVHAELIPLASPIFEPGPPDENDVELARVIDRGLRSASAIKLEDMSVIPGKQVWRVFVDIYPIDHDGNFIDASGLAAMAALLNTRVPKLSVTPDGTVTRAEEKVPLPINDIPVFVTFAKIGDVLVVDPCYEEELVMDARVTFAITKSGNVCAIQKGGRGSFTPEEILKALDTAQRLAPELCAQLEAAAHRV